jgi:hypothetical protein
MTSTTAAITADELTEGLRVSFRPAFSAVLAGIVYEVVPHDDGSLIHGEYEGGRPYCAIRTRVGKSRPRWSYRLALISDLIHA